MQDKIGIDTLIAIAEEELAQIDAKRDRLLKQIETLKRKKEGVKSTKLNITSHTQQPAIANLPLENDNIALFRSLFRGREDVLEAVKDNRFPVLLTERRQHLEMLSDILSPMLQNVFILHGGLSHKRRQRLSEKIKAVSGNEEKVIIATGRYLGEGFDEARLDTLFLTLPILWKGLLNQYAGRLHRLHELKKEVTIYDYVDSGVPMLAKMFKKRIQGYKAIGYEIMDNIE